ncbi:ParB/RepB/Spo0J family partition protein [Clostridiaceae bacterium M8S5]|nr:ParB/RepB/Spo0J family partition protein [Clostridiaceae bacterium M8S5]
MVKKRGLGKGLAALIPESSIEDVNTDDRIEYIDINMLEPNINQPRKNIDISTIEELAKSIKEHGVLQPIIVRKKKKGYQIIAGERRWRATRLAGSDSIPCIVRNVEDIKSAEMALIENVQRENLNPIEEAIAYDNIAKKYDFTQEDLSKIVGKSRPYVSNLLRLLKLDGEIVDMINDGTISGGHGKALLMLNDKDNQLKLAKQIENKGLSVRETEKLVKKINDNEGISNSKKTNEKKEPQLIYIEDGLMKKFGTRVNVIKKKKKGKIEIEFYNQEDLNRIVDMLIDNEYN